MPAQTAVHDTAYAIPKALLRRLKGLQKLADHAASDPAEAAAAAARVQALIARYRLDPGAVEAALRGDNEKGAVRAPEGAEIRTVWEGTSTTMPTWVGQLGMAVAKANGCECYRDRGLRAAPEFASLAPRCACQGRGTS